MSLLDALRGIHPVVALIIFLLVGPPALLSKTAARAPGVLGAAGRWWQGREPSSASYRVSQTEIERIRTDYTRILADYEALNKRMDALEEELSAEKRRAWAAIGYIRRLIDSHQRHAPDAEIPQPPDLIRDILG